MLDDLKALSRDFTQENRVLRDRYREGNDGQTKTMAGYPDGRTEISYENSETHRSQNIPGYSERYPPSGSASYGPSPYFQEQSMAGYPPTMYSPGNTAYPPGTSYTMAPSMSSMSAPQGEPRYQHYTYEQSQRGDYGQQAYGFGQNSYGDMSRSSRPEGIPSYYPTAPANAPRMGDPSRGGYYEDSPMGGMLPNVPGGYPSHRAQDQPQYDGLARDSRQQSSESSFPRTGRR